MLIDYIPHNTTITGPYYDELIGEVRESVKLKRIGKLSKGVILICDNAPAHRSGIASLTIREVKFTELPLPAYSQDSSRCNFFLFGNLEKPLPGKQFIEDEEMKLATVTFFNAQPSEGFKVGSGMLIYQFEKCIELLNDYVEKGE